jgi:hypothetical protein
MKPEAAGAIEKAAPPATAAVVEWLLTGASEQQVAEALVVKYPEADAKKVMGLVQEYLQGAGRPNADAVRGWALLSYRRLYQEMLRVGDFNGCRQVVKEITALLP